MQELRIEDCTSDGGAEHAPWEDAMRVMPPLLELADMFNLILRRCRASRADSDLVRGGCGCTSAYRNSAELHVQAPCRAELRVMLVSLELTCTRIANTGCCYHSVLISKLAGGQYILMGGVSHCALFIAHGP